MPSAPASSHAGDRDNVRDVGRQLDVDGFGRHGLHGARHLGGTLGRRAERHAAVPHVGARDIDLDDANLRLAVDPLAAIGVLLDRKAADIGDHGFMEKSLQARQLLGDHGVDARVLQPHGIDHARRTFGNAGRGVSEARIARGALERERPEDVDVVKIPELVAVPERTAGRHDRVVQSQAAQADGHIRSGFFRRPVLCDELLVYHMTSPFVNTGPSLQMRLLPYLVLHEQPMQAPKPQPMRSSNESCPSCCTASHNARSIGSGPQA